MTVAYLIAFLSNCDSSIVGSSLGDHYKVVTIPESIGIDFISDMESVSQDSLYMTLRLSNPCLDFDEHQFYAAIRKMEAEMVVGKDGTMTPSGEDTTKMLASAINLLLRTNSLKLFKEGDLGIGYHYGFYQEEKKTKKIFNGSGNTFIGRTKFHLEETEKQQLQTFLKEFKLPFKLQFLNLAFNHLEMSYSARSDFLAFLILMIGLEVLFCTSKTNILRQVSSRCSRLLSPEPSSEAILCQRLKDLYDIRSEVVHTGRSPSLDSQVLLELRDILRKSIVTVYKMNVDKPDLIRSLSGE